ncbi:MAG: hypothetical protein ACE369_21030, partial [Roseovarius sp.]
LTLRMDYQIQVELQRSRQRYFMGLSLLLLGMFCTLFLPLALVVPDAEGRLPWALAYGVALALQGIVRAYAVARQRGVAAFEMSNIAKNALALGLSAVVPGPAIAALFVIANLVHGLLSVGFLGILIGGRVRVRMLDRLWRAPRRNFRRARKIVTFSFPNSFIGMATGRLPLIALEAMLPSGVASAFLAANRLALSPLNFLVAALRIVGLIELNKRRADIPNRFRFLAIAIFASAPILLAPLLFPGLLAPLVRGFDPSWVAALDYLPIMYPWAVTFLWAGWMDRVFDALGTQHRIFMIEVTMLAVMASVSALIWAGTLAGTGALVVVSLVSAAHSVAWVGAFLYGEMRSAGATAERGRQ